MVFWRKKNNQGDQEREERDNRLLHRPGDPDLEPPTEYDSDIDPDLHHALQESERELLEDLDETPVPPHNRQDDAEAQEDEQPEEAVTDHNNEGGWLSRLTTGLSRSAGKITQGLADLVTKSRLDEKVLEQLEEILIEADLGPKTAARVIEDFSRERFGKDMDNTQIQTALAESMAGILEPVARALEIKKPESGPFVIVVCGVNGVGKTTTIGKLAHQFHFGQKKSVMIAAGDTFRAAALEQLAIWAERSGSKLVSKDIGADAAAVAFEAYQQAKDEGADILMIDTAGRLQNKKNLMEELGKIIRVLKKQDESLPHATLLVLDATTGQNAFSQVKTFGEMIDITGLVVTKLDGSARGGVLVGLADQFSIPVYAVGVGENIEDMQPFNAREYARSLVGLAA